MIYQCEECGRVLEEHDLNITRTTYESYYGVDHLFGNKTDLTLLTCPCGGEVDDITNEIKSEIEEAVEEYKNHEQRLLLYLEDKLGRELLEVEKDIAFDHL